MGCQVDSFAASFLQNDETHADWWNLGSIRYNSDIPFTVSTPEPSTAALLILALSALILQRRTLLARLKKSRSAQCKVTAKTV